DRDRFDGVAAIAGSGLVMPPGMVPPLVRSEVDEQRPGGVLVKAGMTMAEIERAAIESALRETRGNRRKAAETLAIGERTLYRKLKEYNLPLGTYDSDN